MSERIDRRIGNSRLLLVTVIIILLLAAAAGVVAWIDMQQNPPSLPADHGIDSDRLARSDEPLIVSLHVPAEGMLAPGTAGVKRQPDTQGQAREVLFGLFTDPRAMQSPVLKEFRLRECFLDGAGGAYVDLAPVSDAAVKASAWEELIAIYAIVNTLTQNFEEITHVRFLVDGREALTLAGHIDLSKKFTQRMDLNN